jgi:hypothetical protein
MAVLRLCGQGLSDKEIERMAKCSALTVGLHRNRAGIALGTVMRPETVIVTARVHHSRVDELETLALTLRVSSASAEDEPKAPRPHGKPVDWGPRVLSTRWRQVHARRLVTGRRSQC